LSENGKNEGKGTLARARPQGRRPNIARRLRVLNSSSAYVLKPAPNALSLSILKFVVFSRHWRKLKIV